ncbi:MAG: acyl-CoA desaturase [Rariglobus sp.]|jgi:stearoyl-CoA desaturase (delta-9 desaturase)|nr:acyl-CoA desaturase [Rariglobus sp.]
MDDLPPPGLQKFGEPVESVVLWRGRRFGLDLINVLTLGTVLVPTFVIVILVIVGWQVWVRPIDLLMLGTGLLLGGFGITVGYHRLFTHSSFRTKPVVKGTLGILGAVCMQGPILFWCSCHRAHHQHSDRDGDPHSPHLSGDTWIGKLRGFMHAHFGWIVFSGSYRYNASRVHDLYRDPVVRWVDDRYLLWVFLGLAVPALLGGLWSGTIEGAIQGFVWAGLGRVVLMQHMTWAINSFGHLFGSKPFETNDESRNNRLLALLGLGEGWHNNHHAFPQSARHGIRKGEPDLSFDLIRFLEKLGWVWDVRQVTEKQIEQKLRKR